MKNETHNQMEWSQHFYCSETAKSNTKQWELADETFIWSLKKSSVVNLATGALVIKENETHNQMEWSQCFTAQKLRWKNV